MSHISNKDILQVRAGRRAGRRPWDGDHSPARAVTGHRPGRSLIGRPSAPDQNDFICALRLKIADQVHAVQIGGSRRSSDSRLPTERVLRAGWAQRPAISPVRCWRSARRCTAAQVR